MQQLIQKAVKVFNGCNPNELDIIISKYYPYAFDDIKNNSISYKLSHDNDDDALNIVFFNTGTINKINCNNESSLSAILNDIEKYLNLTITKSDNCLIYTSVSFQGLYFRLRNDVIIRPFQIPEENLNQFKEGVLTQFPNILEFTYDGSDHKSIDIARQMRRKIELVTILNLLFKFEIADDSEDRGLHYGISRFEEDGKWRAKQGFFYKGVSIFKKPDLISDYDKTGLNNDIIETPFKIKQIQYQDNALYLSNQFIKPEVYKARYTDIVLDKFFSNNIKNKTLVKATYWFSKAALTPEDNFSLIVVYLTSALECLIDQSSEKCTCGEAEKYSIKTKVKDFITEYCGDISKHDNDLLDIISKFYDVRSKVIHGAVLPFEVPNQRNFDPVINKIRLRIRYYKFIVRLVLLNWYQESQLNEDIKQIKRSEWSNTSNWQHRVFYENTNIGGIEIAEISVRTL